MAPSLVEHVVADAGAFLKKAPLQVSFLPFWTLITRLYVLYFEAVALA